LLILGCGGSGDGGDRAASAYAGAADSPDTTAPRLPAALPGAYRLPWTCGHLYVVTQGNRGDECGILGNHTGVEEFAWDFGLPLRTPVLAARAGVVTLAATYSPVGSSCYNGCPMDRGGSDLEQQACCSRCLYSANRINVEHADGDISSYSHLSEVMVSAGQMVAAGELIGYSGTSGCSTGPHLHFQIMRGCNTGYCQSLPRAFDDAGVPGCGAKAVSQNGCDWN
jgi:murein DD-endopeptidase MepM/ murein hydrolase activator NlpD